MKIAGSIMMTALAMVMRMMMGTVMMITPVMHYASLPSPLLLLDTLSTFWWQKTEHPTVLQHLGASWSACDVHFLIRSNVDVYATPLQNSLNANRTHEDDRLPDRNPTKKTPRQTA